jgi:hypothetical protein
MSSTVNFPTPQSHNYQPSISTLASSPGPFVRGGDQIRLNATTTDSSGELTLAYRFLTKANEEIVTGRLTMTFSGTGVQTAITTPLAEGWIIGFAVYVSSGTITDGEVQASVDVIQGNGNSASVVMCLASGEVTNIRQLGLGAYNTIGGVVTITSPTVTTDTAASPAAGAEFTITVPASEVWDFYSLNARFVSSGSAGNREPSFAIKDGTNTIYRASINAYQIASRDFRYSFARNVPLTSHAGTNNIWTVPCPPIRLAAGYTIGSVTGGILVGDQWSGIAICYGLEA